MRLLAVLALLVGVTGCAAFSDDNPDGKVTVAAAFYPLAFAVLAYAFLGTPATTRQSRAFALGLTVFAVGALRFFGFGATIFSSKNPSAIVMLRA